MGGLFPNEAIDQIWVLYREKPRGILDVGRRGSYGYNINPFLWSDQIAERKAPKGNEQMLNDNNWLNKWNDVKLIRAGTMEKLKKISRTQNDDNS